MIQLDRNIHPQQVSDVINLITPDDKLHKAISENSPALVAMTDLKKVTAFQIESNASIDTITNRMKACGVKLLFVHDAQDNLLGLVTTTDTQGEKPLLHITQNGGSRDDITAQEIMTPLDKLEGFPLEEVNKCRVVDIVNALKECRRNHMLVIENHKEGQFIRGIFSATQLNRLLDTDIAPSSELKVFPG